MKCEFQEICPTTNFWVKEKKDYIKTVCNTEESRKCVQRMSLVAQKIRKGTEEWESRVKHFEERRKLFPPHGLIQNI